MIIKIMKKDLSKRNVFVLGLEGEFLGELFHCGLDNLVAIVSR